MGRSQYMYVLTELSYVMFTAGAAVWRANVLSSHFRLDQFCAYTTTLDWGQSLALNAKAACGDEEAGIPRLA